jgi:ABC-type transporter Mla subunit MlaD
MFTMAAFALSCFGLLLFLWISFGGPTPLKSKGYRFDVALPEATQLAVEANVRVAGVEVGKVRAKRRDAAGNRTIATIEIDPRYAPIPRDAHVAQRSKTLLGETYLELTTGSRSSTRSTRTRARRSAPGSSRSRRASAAAARTSTTRSATCPGSSRTAATCSTCSTSSAPRLAASCATPESCSRR